MVIPETFRPLLEAKGVAVLSTIEPDGTPHASVTFFLLDDDGKVKFSLNGARRKVQNLLRTPKASVLFVDPQDPYRTLEMRGDVTLDVDTDFRFRGRVDAKYGIDAGQYDQPGDTRYVVTLEPTSSVSSCRTTTGQREREWPPPDGH